MKFLAGVRSTLERVAAALLVSPSATLALRAGRLETARRRFTWVIRKNPGSFHAHVQLGRLCLRRGDQLEALRLLNQARWIDPFRFERLPLPAHIHRMLGRSSFFRTRGASNRSGRGMSWSPDAPSFQEEPRFDGSHLRSGRARDSQSETKTFRFRDFTSMEEYLRFRSLPPISREEVHTVDWELLLARLEGDAR
jgi:hypothetical protein